jgi:hypothetical protein
MLFFIMLSVVSPQLIPNLLGNVRYCQVLSAFPSKANFRDFTFGQAPGLTFKHLLFWKGLPGTREYLRGKYHCTIELLFDWFGISCMTTDNFCFYLQNRLIQTSQTGGQQYSDTSLFSIPCGDIHSSLLCTFVNYGCKKFYGVETSL